MDRVFKGIVVSFLGLILFILIDFFYLGIGEYAINRIKKFEERYRIEHPKKETEEDIRKMTEEILNNKKG